MLNSVLVRFTLFALALTLIPTIAAAQQPHPLPLPDLPLRTTGEVRQGLLLPDSRRVIAGTFRWVHGEEASGRLQRLPPDGHLDRTWNPTAAFDIFAKFAADDAGNVYVLSENHREILKLSHVDASVVPAFQATANDIGAIVVREGMLYASGDWLLPGGARASLVRLSLETGAPDPTFAPNINSPDVDRFVFDPQGRIYLEAVGGFRRISPSGVVDPVFEASWIGRLGDFSASNDALYVADSEITEVWRVRKLRASDGVNEQAFEIALNGTLWSLQVDADRGLWIGGNIHSRRRADQPARHTLLR